MSKNTKNIRDDEMWCPECGAPIKKGFFTCANCKFKVKLTKDINKKQVKKKKSKSSGSKGGTGQNKDVAGPRQNKDLVVAPEADVTDEEKNELLDDIFKEDDPLQESKKPGGRPGWWGYS
ncbi:MAG: hypothetical protein E3J58_00605 [Actinomycetota bacterium]|nr:MAG: hypothetical protein E3J58_00605 [Actinomycetota bacterium]